MSDRRPGRPREHGDRLSITVRLDPDLVARLDEEAHDREVGRTLLVDRALRHYLDRLVPVDELVLTIPDHPEQENQ